MTSEMRTKTSENFHELAKAMSYSSELARNISTGFNFSVRKKIKQQLSSINKYYPKETQELAKLGHLKLMAAKQKKLQLEREEELKRVQIEKQLIQRQENSMKNLTLLKQTQRKSFILKSNKLKSVIKKHHQKQLEEMKNTLNNFDKQNKEMVTFYVEKENKKKEYYSYLQDVHKKRKNQTDTEPFINKSTRRTLQQEEQDEEDGGDVNNTFYYTSIRETKPQKNKAIEIKKGIQFKQELRSSKNKKYEGVGRVLPQQYEQTKNVNENIPTSKKKISNKKKKNILKDKSNGQIDKTIISATINNNNTTIKRVLNNKEKIKQAAQEKQQRIINEYGKKMEEIITIRNRKSSIAQPQVPVSRQTKTIFATLPLIDQRRQRQSPEENEIDKIRSQNKKQTYRFSQQYSKRLQQKKAYLNRSLEKRMVDGYELLNQQKRIRERNKVNKLLNETKNEVRRRVHFSFMQTMKNMKQPQEI